MALRVRSKGKGSLTSAFQLFPCCGHRKQSKLSRVGSEPVAVSLWQWWAIYSQVKGACYAEPCKPVQENFQLVSIFPSLSYMDHRDVNSFFSVK